MKHGRAKTSTKGEDMERSGLKQTGGEPLNEGDLETVRTLFHALAFRMRGMRYGGIVSGNTWLDVHILQLVAERPGILIKEVRESYKMPHSTLTSVINRLEDQGLLKRVINPKDRRSFGLEITPAGLKVQEEHNRADHAMAAVFLQALDSNEERKTFIGLLQKILRNL